MPSANSQTSNRVCIGFAEQRIGIHLRFKVKTLGGYNLSVISDELGNRLICPVTIFYRAAENRVTVRSRIHLDIILSVIVQRYPLFSVYPALEARGP